MSVSKRTLPAILYLVAGALALVAAFLAGDEPTNWTPAVVGIVLLVLAGATFRRGRRE
jgi:uncharacterized membrane protein HdeD (DUF308 family)